MAGGRKSLKRLGGRKKRSEPIRAERLSGEYLKKVMREINRQTPLDLSKAGAKFKNLEENRKTGAEIETWRIKFEKLSIDKKSRIISSPLSPETASVLEG